MKHIDLISKLYQNRFDIDEVYKNDRDRDFFIGLDKELFKAGVLKRFGKRIILNKNYRNFANSSLNRANIFKRFENYDTDLKALNETFKEFLKTKKEFFKIASLEIIEDIYENIISQDREIKKLIDNITVELSFDIDILISQSERVLKELNILIEAISKVRVTFNETIIGFDEDIDYLSKELLYDLEEYIENIDKYCKSLSKIIQMGKLKKMQNRKLKKLAKFIIEDRDEVLIDFIYLKKNKLNLFGNIKPQSYIALNSDKDSFKFAKKMKETINIPIYKKVLKKTKILKMPQEDAIFIDLDKILLDLNRDGTKDLYKYIKNHSEVLQYAREQKLKESELAEEIFVNFLTIVIPKNENLNFDLENFNDENIRIVEWKNR